MGLLKRLFGGSGDNEDEVKHPGGGFETGRELMEDLIARLLAMGPLVEGSWVRFEIPALWKGKQGIVVEATATEINLGLEELSAPLMLEMRLECVDLGLYRGPWLSGNAGPDAKKMAETLDRILKEHYGLIGDYAVIGKIQM